MNSRIAPGKALTITNPLVLYRALVATKKIEPDPSQHRLAIHLQKLYYRLKDYEPQIEYRDKLNNLTSALHHRSTFRASYSRIPSVFSSSLRQQKKDDDSLALVRTVTDHESAKRIDSPKGLLLHGEVGTGKSMLVDLLADSLPNRKKRRWHFNTFMLETFSRLEKLRIQRLASVGSMGSSDENSLLSLARDMITTSPILFLDEFQLPDRAASKILSNLFTSFFHLGGVLVATSNRMPEELAKASGLEFAPPFPSLSAFGAIREGLIGKKRDRRKSASSQDPQSDFAIFLDVLRARCEVWDIEGERDWRRRDSKIPHAQSITDNEGDLPENLVDEDSKTSPEHYYVLPSSVDPEHIQVQALNDFQRRVEECFPSDAAQSYMQDSIPWETSSLRVYGRDLQVPRSLHQVTLWSFPELCARNLGPADYVSLASRHHTFILTNVPVLSLLEKNEARRFITLLDALYEARCKLLIQAEAGPDDLFFPDAKEVSKNPSNNTTTMSEDASDGTYAETFSEIFQDQISPFRPSVAAYEPTASFPDYDAQPLPRIQHSTNSSSVANSNIRSILADEDSDFGPVYGAGRSSATIGSATSYPRPQSDLFLRDERSPAPTTMGAAPNFQRTSIFTGEDERFAYKRARSRLWEMCSQRWWDRCEEGWWKPIPLEARTWEGGAVTTQAPDAIEKDLPSEGHMKDEGEEQVFRHRASPFRTSPDPPPKISFVHAWGMMRWGKKAGAWGKGPEGYDERSGQRSKPAAGEKDANSGK